MGKKNNSDNECICVLFSLCTNTNNTVNTDGNGIIDFRSNRGQCSHYLEVCCIKKNIILVPMAHNLQSFKKLLGCGYSNPHGAGYRITGDNSNEAQFGEFPWVIAIFHKGINDQKHFYCCVGSLIHPQVVLTAAHCITKLGHYKIRAGEWDSLTTQEIIKHQDRDVSSLVIHRNYRRKNLQNDIGLLFLKSPLEMDQHINVACLPPQDFVFSSGRCFVSGWGRDSLRKEVIIQKILKRIELSVISHGQCEIAFRQTRLGKKFQLHKSFMCAEGEKGMDACTGDGGGPFVCPMEREEGRYQQIGIVSWGIGCGTKGIPGVYVAVAQFRNWIEEQMAIKSLRLSSH